MNILVCDDDPATRLVLKRLLIRTFGAEVDEAENGLDALDRLSTHHFDAILLDVHMPIMGGTQMLEALRASDEFKDLPVIILTGEKDEALIKQIVTLGVSDFILKPPDVQRVTARLARLQKPFGESSGRRGRVEREVPLLRRGDAVVLVDGDAEYRRLFTESTAGLFDLTTVETGAEALRIVETRLPTALFVGQNLGLVSAERLTKTLRECPGARVRLIGIVSRDEADAAQHSGWFDDVIGRSLAGETFRANIDRLMRPTNALGQFQAVVPGLRSALVSAVEQTFSVLLNAEIETADEPLAIGDQRSARATVVLTVEGFTLDVRFRYAFESGRHIAAAFLEANPEEMTDTDIEAAAGELSNVIASRLHDSYVKSGLKSIQGTPNVNSLPPGTPDDAADTEDTIRLSFRSADRLIAIETYVSVSGGQIDAGRGIDTVGAIAGAPAQAG